MANFNTSKSKNQSNTTTTTGGGRTSLLETAAADSGSDNNSNNLSNPQAAPKSKSKKPSSPVKTNNTTTTTTTTADRLPLRAISRDCIALKGNKFVTAIKLQGFNSKLMSPVERSGLMHRFAEIANVQAGPFSSYVSVRPLNMQPRLDRLDRKRQTESNPAMRQQFWHEIDFLRRLDEENSLTEREYTLTLQATEADLKGLGIGGSSNNSNDDDGGGDEPKTGIVGLIKSRLGEVLGQDLSSQVKLDIAAASTAIEETAVRFQYQKVQQKSNKTTADNLVPATLAETMRFRAQSLADQFNLLGIPGRLVSGDEMEDTLGVAMGSPLTANRKKERKTNHRNRNRNISGNRAAAAGAGGAWDEQQLTALDRIAAVSITEEARYVKLGPRHYVSSLFVRDLPKTIGLGALFEIVRFKDLRLSIGVHFRPLTTEKAEKKLQDQQELIVAVQQNDQGGATNMRRAYKLESFNQLRSELARGDAKLFTVGIRVSVQANSKRKVLADLRRVQQRLGEMQFPCSPATRNQLAAYLSTVPFGEDFLNTQLLQNRTIHPNVTSLNVACLFPNCVVDFTQPGGIILGSSKSDGSLITFNRRRASADNAHKCVVATSGAGKTVNEEEEILREMMKDPRLECFYFDPQGIQGMPGNFCDMVGGESIDLGPKGNAIINPMDRYVINGQAETIGERLTFLYPLLTLMTRQELRGQERSAVGRAAKRFYHHLEDGESMLPVLEANYANLPIYAPLRPYLADYQDPKTGEFRPGIMTRLARVCKQLRTKYKIPLTGLVRGRTIPAAGDKTLHVERPICYLADKIYWYRGEGTTNAPFVERPEGYKPGEMRPAGVLYSDPVWFKQLSDEFEQVVQDEGIFDMLDLTALGPAIRDAFVELKVGMGIFSDFLPFLAAEGATDLVLNLDQYADPEIYGSMFNGFTNVQFQKRFISFNVRDLSEDLLRPIRIFQAISYTWGKIKAHRKPRIMVVDEFGFLIKNFVEVGNYISDLFMRGRFFGLSMTAIVQNISHLLDYPAALTCVENADRFVLMKQKEAAIHRLRDYFNLTDGQCFALMNASKGECLQKIDGRWVHVQYKVPPEVLIGTDTQIKSENQDTDDEDSEEAS